MNRNILASFSNGDTHLRSRCNTYAQDQIVLKYMTWASGEAATWIQEDLIEPFVLRILIKIEYELSLWGSFGKLMTMYAAGNPPDHAYECRLYL